MTYPLKTYSNTDYPGDDGHIQIGETWVNHITKSAPVKEARRASLKNWWMAKYLTDDTLEEKMVIFWHNHFGVPIDPIYESHIAWKYHNTIREHCLGSFMLLIKFVTFDPAMLIFLNGDGSTLENPNVNYARELRERFTMGLGKYTEDQLKIEAIILSGFTVEKATGEVVGDGYRVFSFIDTLFKSHAADISYFITEKMMRYFTGRVDDTTIKELAQGFQVDWEIKPLVEKILQLPTVPQIKSPIDIVKSVKQDFNIPLPSDPVILYRMMGQLRKKCAEMGMDLGEPPSVKGWDAFTQAPGFDTLWYQSDTAVIRAKFLESLFDPWTFQLDPPHTFWIDVLEFTKGLEFPSDPAMLVAQVHELLFKSDITDEMEATLKSILLSDQSEDRYWTNAWNRYLADPNERNTAVVKERLTALYKYMILLPEYQLQ